jgi:GAF domain-containing protein
MEPRQLSQPAPRDAPPGSPKIQDVSWRDGFVRLLLIGALTFGLPTLAPAIFVSAGPVGIGFLAAVYVVLAVMVILPTPYRLRLTAFLALAYAFGTGELLIRGVGGQAALFFLTLITFAAMLWSPWVGGAATALTLFTIGIGAVLVGASRPGLPSSTSVPPGILDWVLTAAGAVLFGWAVIAAFRHLGLVSSGADRRTAEALDQLETTRGTLQDGVEARTEQLHAVIEVSRAATAILDPEQLTARVVGLISDRFGYYYAAIFLLNERGDLAELQSATGEAGRLLKERKHTLPVGGRSMVGTAISTRQPRIALDTAAEPARFDNPLLPYTRSEIALPLIVGDRVLGALDVQSTKAGAFGPNEVDTLQGMANQVAIAFENARLFQSSRNNLQELQAIQRQYTRSSWSPLSTGDNLQYRVGDEELTPESPELEIPLSLRDEIIGQISMSAETDWTPEQRNLIEAVATQAALALENARLLETSQSAAQRDHVLAEITGKVWASPTLEGILRTALGDLGHALGADEGRIELKMD